MTDAIPDAGQEDTDDKNKFCLPEKGEHRWQLLLLQPDRKTQMTAATPAAGQENTDDSCYSCRQTGEHR
jgi:hypothetical protein